MPGASRPAPALLSEQSGPFTMPSDKTNLRGQLAVPRTAGRHPAILFLVPDLIEGGNPIAQRSQVKFESLSTSGSVVLAITPRPSPPGTDDMKSPILGPFYLLSLRADLLHRTILGMRIDDVIRAVDYLASRPDVDPTKIIAVSSGHMGLVLLHAAVLDARLQHITIDHTLVSYRSLLEAPLPTGAPEDIIPGVLRHYDIPDLVTAVGTRLTANAPLKGTDDLSQTSTPVGTLRPQP